MHPLDKHFKHTQIEDPIEEYLEAKTAAAMRRVEDDHAIVGQWQQAHQGDGMDPDLTHQTIQRFQPIIQSAIKKFGGPRGGDGLKADARNYTIEALRTFDPNRGATFTTHLTNNLRRLQRENAKKQTSYIPEASAAYIGDIQRAHDEFHDEFGRPPTVQEHEKYLNDMLPEKRRLAPGRMEYIQSLQRNVIPSSTFEGQPNTYHQDLEQQNVALARHDLSEQHQKVYDLIYTHGVTSTGSIAKQLGMSAPAVSRAKNVIERTVNTMPVPKQKRKGPGQPGF